MSVLNFDATTSTPAVAWNPDSGELKISGESYPENAMQFYQPILAAVADHLRQPKASLYLFFNVRYLNTSSVKAVMDLLDLAEEAHQQGAEVRVVWRHDPDDDRAQEVAEEFCEDLSLPFVIQAVAEGEEEA